MPTSQTTYTVVGTDGNGCKNSDTVTVFTKTKTTSIIDTGGQICQGDFIQLRDSAGGNASYTWIPATGLSDNHSYHPIASPSTTTKYIVIAQQGSCIPDTESVTVIVHPKPIINLGPDQTIIAGNSAQLDATGTYISKYSWHPAGTLSCDTCYNPLATPAMTTKYTVDATSDYGCEDSAHITIYVVCDHSQVFMPNSFTPNGDGVNDKFYPRGKGLKIINSFRIYDRWGQLIFQQQSINTNDKNVGWDGTFKGVLLSPDVFVYVIDAICETGEAISWKGDISLIR
jgi:gliding motility-associated-like protein